MSLTMLARTRSLTETMNSYTSMLIQEDRADGQARAMVGKTALKIQGLVVDAEEKEVQDFPEKYHVDAKISYVKKTDSYAIDSRATLKIVKMLNEEIKRNVQSAVKGGAAKPVEKDDKKSEKADKEDKKAGKVDKKDEKKEMVEEAASGKVEYSYNTIGLIDGFKLRG